MKKLTRFSIEYPDRLQDLMDPPAVLHVLGEVPKDGIKTVGIIGARMCSQYGRSQAYYFAKELSKYGVQIISGMAKGIDSAAHQGAIDSGGKTFAVLGCGVDICYPSSSSKIYSQMIKQGGVISEYEEGSKPLPFHFPERNRIISGLSDVLIVVEAKEKSGSLITVDCALEQGKTVFAIPGRVGDELSYGCNRLISEGAAIAYDIEPIIQELGIDLKTCKNIQIKETFSREQRVIYNILEIQSKSLQTIIDQTQCEPRMVTRVLFELLLKEAIVEPVKNYFAKKI